MSTRSNIAILLRPEDRNKDFKTPWGEVVNANGKKYLYVYCHHDGYPEGVGADLIHMFDGGDYEDVIKYIMLGDRTSSDLSYWDWRKERLELQTLRKRCTRMTISISSKRLTEQCE